MKKEYTIITAASANDLELSVNERLKDGWECQGGISIAMLTESGREFCQAMVKDVTDGKTAQLYSG